MGEIRLGKEEEKTARKRTGMIRKFDSSLKFSVSYS
jgi:hypothetical protein